MNFKFKKALLVLLIFPASIHWLGMTLLGLMIFANGTFYDVASFFVTAIILVGLFSLGVAFFSAIRYPKISGFSVYSIGAGCAALAIALYMGLYAETSFLISACSLFLGSLIIMVDFVRSN